MNPVQPVPAIAAPSSSAANAEVSVSAPGAVVIGGDYQGLGIVRSLGRRGVPTCVIDDEQSIARFSRYATHALTVPDLRDEARTVETLLDIASRWNLRGWVLFPTRDETVAAISRHRATLMQVFRVPTPEWPTVRWAWDKRNTYDLAQRLGIAMPRTWYAESIADLSRLDLPFPIAIKPAIKEHLFYATRAKAWRADNRRQLEHLFARAASHVDCREVMLQELIPAGGKQQVAFCSFFKEGQSLGSMTVRRARQHPPQFGRASTYVETVRLPELQEISEKFLRAIDYYGLVEMEYKYDVRDGQYKLLDVNARTWGYHSLGFRAGVDFPVLLFSDQLHFPVIPRRAREDVAWIRMATDVPTAILQMFSGSLSWKEYFRSLRRAGTEAVLSLDDVRPWLAELALLPYLIVRRGF